MELSGGPGTDGARGCATVVGVVGDRLDDLPADSRQALADSDWVAGGTRLLEAWSASVGAQLDSGARGRPPGTIDLAGDADGFAHQIAHRVVDQGDRVCVLASGDPGFFGVLRALVRVIDRSKIRVLPAPSSVAVAFARARLSWDDAVVVSAHGRPLADAVRVVRLARKAAVLTSPDTPPQVVGRALSDADLVFDLVVVASRLGCTDESVTETSLHDLARGTWDPLSVVILVGPGGLQPVGWSDGAPHDGAAGVPSMSPMPAPVPHGPSRMPVGVEHWPVKTLAWGLPDQMFTHRNGMITKAEVRAVVLGKLTLPHAGVLWDVGAGSGSIAVECARLCPGLTVFAVEQADDAVPYIAANAAAHQVAVHLVVGTAPQILGTLPDPDRAFVGGGGIDVLDAVLRRLRPGGTVVASYAAIDRAAAAAERLGAIAQVTIGRGTPLAGGGFRLAAENPVFVVWGPGEDGTP